MKLKRAAKRLLACLLFSLMLVQPLGALAAGTDTESDPLVQSDISVTTSVDGTADSSAADTSTGTTSQEIEGEEQQPGLPQDTTGNQGNSTSQDSETGEDDVEPNNPDADQETETETDDTGTDLDGDTDPEPDQTPQVPELEAGGPAQSTNPDADPPEKNSDPDVEQPEMQEQEDTPQEVSFISEVGLSKAVVYVSRGTSIEEMIQQLPTEGECTLSDGTSAIIPITWICAADDQAEYTADPSTIPWLIFWPQAAGDYSMADTVERYDLPYAVVAFSDDLASQVSPNAYGSTSFTTTTPYSNYITDTQGWGLSTKREHICNTDGTIAYCLTQGAADPDGRNFHFLGYVDNATAVILDHGYPKTTVIGGVALSASQAAQATQAAIWAVSGYNFKHPVSIGVLRSTGRDDGSTLAAAQYLVALSQSSSSSSQYAVYEPDGGQASGYQYMVSTTSESGTLRVQKSSAVPSLTNGNGSYSLAGAVFGVYADAACSAAGWRATITTDASGSTQSVTLSPGTYYIREQHAPANYVRDSVVHSATVTAGSATVVPISNYPVRGVIQIRKSSTNPGLTNGNSNYSLAGAVFGIYNSSGQEVQRLTTDSNGAADSGQLPVGTYTVKEITASKGYELNTSTFTANISPIVANQTANTGGVYLAAQYDKNGTLYFEVRNAGAYAGTGLRAAVWTESSGQDDLRWFDLTMKSDRTTFYGIEYTDGHPGTGIVYMHIYGGNGGGFVIGAGFNFISYDNWVKASVSVPETPKPLQGYIEIQKTSAAPDITNGNSCYSLSGAVYGVYSNAGCTNLVTTLTTNSSGYAKSGALNQGTYYVKEISAPQGYMLDTEVYPVTVNAGATTPLNVQDDPANDPIGITLTKIQETPNAYIPSLEGAQFTINYYAGQYSSVDQLPSSPTRSWVIETKAVSNGSVTKYFTMMNDTYKIGGDEFFYDSTGQVIVPLGTITIQETKAPVGYTTEGGYLNDSTGTNLADTNGIVLLNVTQDGLGGTGFLQGGNTYTKEEALFRDCSITLTKKGSAGQLLEGAEFKLEILNPETGEYDYLETGTTGSNGQILFDELIFGTYRITEIATVGSSSLLADPIIVTLPVTTEGEAGTSTPTYTEDGTDYYCDISFTVQNGVIIMPHAGGIGILPMTITGMVLLAAAGAIILFSKRKRGS